MDMLYPQVRHLENEEKGCLKMNFIAILNIEEPST
jgi:hypothetical protein